jgi:hypothetical protein
VEALSVRRCCLVQGELCYMMRWRRMLVRCSAVLRLVHAFAALRLVHAFAVLRLVHALQEWRHARLWRTPADVSPECNVFTPMQPLQHVQTTSAHSEAALRTH